LSSMLGMPLDTLNARPVSGHSRAPSSRCTSSSAWWKAFRNDSSCGGFAAR
jgi:hypothetical protein